MLVSNTNICFKYLLTVDGEKTNILFHGFCSSFLSMSCYKNDRKRYSSEIFQSKKSIFLQEKLLRS